MGNVSFIIGIKSHKGIHRGILRLSQKTYINKILGRFRMKDCISSVALIVKGNKFSLNQW